MQKLTSVVLLLLFCAYSGRAQQANQVSDSTLADSVARSRTGGGALFIDFTAASNESNRVLLKWDIDPSANVDPSAAGYFVIERSPDETHYETIGVVRIAAGTDHYEVTDGAAPNGSDFYRVKYAARTGAMVYSKTMQLSLSGTVDFKFYPNPVDKLFIVRTEHTIDLQVIDAAGAVRVSKRLQPGIQVVNVSSLEKGVYVLRVTDKESNRAVSHQLVKN
ncbi:MAG TPA: T9SS type A sorting domain-containing protein [Puia sp.]|nr:T9SS type A sorting domain-containing protein [Puia sp.]